MVAPGASGPREGPIVKPRSEDVADARLAEEAAEEADRVRHVLPYHERLLLEDDDQFYDEEALGRRLGHLP